MPNLYNKVLLGHWKLPDINAQNTFSTPGFVCLVQFETATYFRKAVPGKI